YCLRGQAAVDNKNVPLHLPGGPRRRVVDQGITLSERHPGFVQLFRHPHPPRQTTKKLEGHSNKPPAAAAAAATAVESAISGGEATDDPWVSTAAVRSQTASVESFIAAKGGLRRSSAQAWVGTGRSAAAGGAAWGQLGGGLDTIPSVASANVSAEGGGASIFGVAFDDYIGEDGVRASPEWVDRAGGGAAGAVVGGGIGGGGCGGGTGSKGGRSRASVQEDERALAFAYDVELRLEPWYGRNILPKTPPFTPAMSDSNLVAPGIAATIGPPGDSGGGSKGSSGGSSSDGGGGGGDGGSHRLRAADDLLACGCILAEMCAGEPVLSAPSFVRGERVLGGGERRGGAGGGGEGGSWLDVAVDVPPALRGAIAALTHADPEKRPSAQDLLATVEPGRSGRASAAPTASRGYWTSRPVMDGPPPYRGLFPPYMRDVYAFLAALHQEETPHKRLLLAAATLPVLQVPLPAFFLVMPHIVALLAYFPRPSAAPPPRQNVSSDSGGTVDGSGGGEVGGGNNGVGVAGGDTGGSAGHSSSPTSATATAHRKRRPQRPLHNGAKCAAGAAAAASSRGMAKGSPLHDWHDEDDKDEPSSSVTAGASGLASDIEQGVPDITRSITGGGSGVFSRGCSKDSCEAPPEIGHFSQASAAVYDTYSEEHVSVKPTEWGRHVEAWVTVVDICAARLGPRLAGESLLPTVLAVLERVSAPEIACDLISAGLWGMLARRFITDSFLRVIFPLLLAWIDHGVGEIASECSDHLDHPSSGDPGGWVAPIAKAHAGSVECMMGNSAGGSDGGGGGGSGSVCEDEERSSRPRILREDVVATELDAASRVQVDAAGAVSGEVFDYLGPTLASRYLVPAMVDCLGRLAAAAADSAAAIARKPEAASSFPTMETRPVPPARSAAASDARQPVSPKHAAEPPPPPPPPRTSPDQINISSCPSIGLGAGGGGDGGGGAGGEDPGLDEGVEDDGLGGGRGNGLLLISRALGNMCLKASVGSEEVTVPFVLSRIFCEILPCLEDVLTQRCGPAASAAGFRCSAIIHG
ncbi:unnamed protein product, partial [Sphacelaria rigidula]